MNIIDLPIKAIKPYKRNPRRNDKAVEYVANSIRQFGFKVPIVIDENYEIVCGHTRWKAAKTIGLDTVPCIMADDLNEDQIRAFRLADNKTAEMADWDFDLLEMEFNEIDPDLFDMSDFGFFQDGETEDKAPTEVTEDDFDESTVTEAVCKRGQVWQLGAHRLMCGDSTSAEDVARLMNGEKADMVFTDPPYGVNVRGEKGHGGMIQGDLTQTAIPFSFDLAVTKATKQKSHFYFCGAEANLQLYQMLFDRYLHILPKHLIWVKNGFVMKQNGYHNQFEIIYHGYKEGSGGLWYGGRTEDEASDVWHIKRDPSVSYAHPTQKPIEIPARAIRNSCPPRGSVLDMFGGSGSTLIACEQLDRRCFMMELDPHYCDVIIRRWEDFTGKKAELSEE